MEANTNFWRVAKFTSRRFFPGKYKMFSPYFRQTHFFSQQNRTFKFIIVIIIIFRDAPMKNSSIFYHSAFCMVIFHLWRKFKFSFEKCVIKYIFHGTTWILDFSSRQGKMLIKSCADLKPNRKLYIIFYYRVLKYGALKLLKSHFSSEIY